MSDRVFGGIRSGSGFRGREGVEIFARGKSRAMPRRSSEGAVTFPVVSGDLAIREPDRAPETAGSKEGHAGR